MSAGSETLYLIDAHSLIFQVFHALPEMSSPSGLPTNAVFGFTKDLLYLRNERKPTYLLCVFDMPGPTFRDAINAEYKAHRAPMPDDLQLQIPLIRQVLEGMRIPVLGIEGFEADDLIATLATLGAARGLEVSICSSDKDLRQLLGERIKIFNLRKQEFYDATHLLRDWGVTPEQVVDFQTLVGDSVDNVKGVPGIGPKTASKLLQDYQTLDNLLARLHEIPGKRREALAASATIIPNSRQLVKLKTDVPLEDAWDQWRLGEWDAPRLTELFRGFGFHRFTKLVSGEGPEPNVPAQAPPRKEVSDVTRPASTPGPNGEIQGDLFAGAEEGPVSRATLAWEATYHLVDTPEFFARFLDELRKQPLFAFDLETTSLEPRRAAIVGLAFCWREAEAWYLPVRGPAGDKVLEEQDVLQALRPIWEDARVGKMNQNIKYDLQVLKQHGIQVAGVVGDSMVADYLLHAGERSHGMDVLADKHLNHRVIPISELIGKGKKQKRMDQVPCAGRGICRRGRGRRLAPVHRLEPLLKEMRMKRPGPGELASSSITVSEALFTEEPASAPRTVFIFMTTSRYPSSKCWPTWNSPAFGSTCHC